MFASDWSERNSNAKGSGSDCELLVLNDSSETIILCWIGENDGKLYHYRVICGGVRDRSVSKCSLEITQPFHAFVCLKERAEYATHLNKVSLEVNKFCNMMIRVLACVQQYLSCFEILCMDIYNNRILYVIIVRRAETNDMN